MGWIQHCTRSIKLSDIGVQDGKDWKLVKSNIKRGKEERKLKKEETNPMKRQVTTF